MDTHLTERAQAYAAKQRLRLAKQLGFGIHGIIFATEGNPKSGENASAIKAHRQPEFYARELTAYERLTEAKVREILGFNVPQLLRCDNELCVIEMSIVARPFVLDFAGAYVDFIPEFPEEVWQQWEADKREQFEDRWPKVRAILRALEDLGIHMIDVSPGNIAFRD